MLILHQLEDPGIQVKWLLWAWLRIPQLGSNSDSRVPMSLADDLSGTFTNGRGTIKFTTKRWPEVKRQEMDRETGPTV